MKYCFFNNNVITPKRIPIGTLIHLSEQSQEFIPNIVILQAITGNATVVFDVNKYISKINALR